jgi:uncharacterized sulfatase
MLKHSAWIGFLAAVAALAPGLTPARAAPGGERPNVLFVSIDDLRNETGCYGKPQVKTPNIDRLARAGMRFDRAYVQATFCNPSRTSLLTGLRPDRTGVADNRTWFRKKLPDAVTLPQLFRENGYHTMRLGKIYHAGESMEDPRAWDVAKYPRPTPLGHKGERRNLTGGKIRWCWWMAAAGGDEDQPDGQIAREAVRFLGQEHEQPFFLAVGFHKPHDPFVAPKKYFDLYPPEKIELYRDPPGRAPDPRWSIPTGWKREFDKFTDRERREFLRAYYACTSFMDAQLGKVLDALEKRGLAERTIICLWSDHGYHLGERGWWNKSTLYELTARSPLIVYAPEMKARGKSCSRLVEFVDIYPTLAGMCGLKAPPGLEGRSFAPLLDDPGQPWKEAAYTQLRRGRVEGRAVRTERWRYIEWDGGREGAELYDHDADPGEYRNLAGDPQRAGVVKRLKTLLRAGQRG